MVTENTKLRRKKLIIISIMVSFILSGMIWFFSTMRRENFYNKYEISGNNYIMNQTKYDFMDTVIYAGLDELKITNAVIAIKEFDADVLRSFKDNSGMVLEAAIIGNRTQFVIYVTPMSRYTSIRILSHELIHLKQYAEGRLEMQENGLIWNGKSITSDSLYGIEYASRPWEKEAFGYGSMLADRVKTTLYDN